MSYFTCWLHSLTKLFQFINILLHSELPRYPQQKQLQVVDDIHSIFNNAMQKHTPLQPLSRNRRKFLNKPWITQALYKSIKEKNKIYRSLVKNGFENKAKFAYYKRYRNQLTHLLVLSSKECYQPQFLIARNDSAKTWKLINTLLPGRTKATSTLPI